MNRKLQKESIGIYTYIYRHLIYDNDDTAVPWAKADSFQYLELLRYLYGKKEGILTPNSHIHKSQL